MSVLYTIGHGTRSVPELAAVLTAAAVNVVIDVRRHPGSRRNPHLSGDSLAVELPATAALAYEWWGEELVAVARGRPTRGTRPGATHRSGPTPTTWTPPPFERPSSG